MRRNVGGGVGKAPWRQAAKPPEVIGVGCVGSTVESPPRLPAAWRSHCGGESRAIALAHAVGSVDLPRFLVDPSARATGVEVE
jgi:hypothetical protein